MATQVNVSRATPVVGSYAPMAMRSVFTSRLTSEATLSSATLPSVAPTARGSHAWGTVRIVVKDDDTLEYLATIYNPSGETFTCAYLRRDGAAARGDILATLFSDVALRNPYIQVRGTISVARDMNAETLADELRERPGSFTVSVHTSGGVATGAIRGVVE